MKKKGIIITAKITGIGMILTIILAPIGIGIILLADILDTLEAIKEKI